MQLVGSLKSVLSGHVNLDHLEKVDLSRMAYALGAGFIEEAPIHLGETLVIDHHAFMGIPEKTYKEEKQLLTPFLVGIDQKPKTQRNFAEASLNDIYEKLLNDYPKGFVIVADVQFSTFLGAQIKKDPIHQESIQEHSDKYLESIERKNTKAVLFGCVCPSANEKIFYRHPLDASNITFYSHTHAKTEDDCVVHLLPTSWVYEGTFFVDPIT